jgi:hypothetical protein
MTKLIREKLRILRKTPQRSLCTIGIEFGSIRQSTVNVKIEERLRGRKTIYATKLGVSIHCIQENTTTVQRSRVLEKPIFAQLVKKFPAL